MSALRRAIAGCALMLVACTDPDLTAPCLAGPPVPLDRLEFGFVGETTRVELPIAVINSCQLPTAVTVRLSTPGGEARTPLRVEVAGSLSGNPAAVVDFIADVEGTWTVEARFQSLGQVQRDVAIVGDLRGAPLQPFPFTPEGAPCAVPLLTAGGSALCVDLGLVRWPGAATDGGLAQPVPTSALWVAGERVWLARDDGRRFSLLALTATGDGGFTASPEVTLPDVGVALSVSGTAQRAVVGQPQHTAFFTVDGAGAPRLERVDPRAGEQVAVAPAGPGALMLTPVSFGKRLCQLEPEGDGGCQEILNVLGVWRAPDGVWLELNAPVGFTLQFVDPRAPASSLLSGASATVPLVSALRDNDEAMAMPAFTAPAPDGGEPLVLLPRLLQNAVNYEAVLRQPATGLLFDRATSTHVYYRDSRGTGPFRWSTLRRAAR